MVLVLRVQLKDFEGHIGPVVHVFSIGLINLLILYFESKNFNWKAKVHYEKRQVHFPRQILEVRSPQNNYFLNLKNVI